ncbi:MAG: MFS transporter [Phycisphaerae bacterium]|nr:MFS transporter [Phycisphaerae bacterium]MCZ2400146.1 MFS transporter [Phycisphaerae bacterium]
MNRASKAAGRVTTPRRWLNRTVLGIGLASLFSDLSHETVTVLLPAFLASLGAAAAALGTVEGVADGLSSAAKLYGGWLADRLRSRKRIAAGGYGVMAVAPLVIAAATVWPVVLAGRVLAWVSRGLRTPARKALLADAVAPEAYGRAFGLERAMDTCGAILAPAAVYVLLAAEADHRTLIAWSAVPALLAVLAIVFLVRERTDREPVKTPFLRSFGSFSKPYKEFLAAVGLFGIGDFADTFYILYAVAVLTPKVGADQAAHLSVAFYVLHNVLYAAWSYAGGWIADHFNRRLLLASGYVCAALAAACMLIGVESYVGLGLMFALGGMGVGIYEAVEDTIAAELLPREIRGSGFGALAVVTGMGDLISSLLFGWLWAAVGVAGASVAVLVPMLAGTGFVLHLATCDHRNRAAD